MSLARIMARNTPLASSRTVAETMVETARAVAARPRVATVPLIHEEGTAAEAMSAANTAAISPADGATPRRVSRVLSRSARPVETPADGALGTSEPPRGLLVRLTLQVTEHHRPAILLRQPADLLVENAPQLMPLDVGGGFHGLGPRPLAFLAWPAGRSGSDSRGDPVSDAMEPGAERVGVAERAGPCNSTRNVAWKASSTSRGSYSSRRQTARTIGP